MACPPAGAGLEHTCTLGGVCGVQEEQCPGNSATRLFLNVGRLARCQQARRGFSRLVIGKHENPNSHDTFHCLGWAAAAGGCTHNFLNVS